MKKKIIVALLACAALSLSACGEKTDIAETTEETTASQPAKTEAKDTSADDEFYTTDLDLTVEGEPEVANAVIDTEYVTIGDYTKLEIEKVEVAQVTDEQVQSEFDSYMAAYAEEVEVTDRDVLENGDIADIDYVGKIDGVAFDGGSANGYRLELGSNTFIDGFEAGLVGVKKGETKTLELTFPENYSNTEYAGKAATFDVTVNGIYKTQSPEITDAFVAEKTEYDSIAAYKEAIKSQIQASNESTALNNKRGAIWAALAENAAVKKYNEEKVADYIIEYKNYMDSAISSTYGMTFDAYLETSGMTKDDFKATALSNSKSMAKQQLFLDAIAEKEGLKATEEDLAEYIKDYMESMGYTTEEEMWTNFTEQGYSKEDITVTMKDNITADNVMTYLEGIVVEK